LLPVALLAPFLDVGFRAVRQEDAPSGFELGAGLQSPGPLDRIRASARRDGTEAIAGFYAVNQSPWTIKLRRRAEILPM
jgi:hypothetical protein